jgi:hypothetical protein
VSGAFFVFTDCPSDAREGAGATGQRGFPSGSGDTPQKCGVQNSCVAYWAVVVQPRPLLRLLAYLRSQAECPPLEKWFGNPRLGTPGVQESGEELSAVS